MSAKDYELAESVIRAWSTYVPEATAEAVAEVLATGWINTGKQEKALRREFGRRFDAERVVACINGTAALKTAYAAIGIGPGDEVISTPYTFIATNTAILELGATPVFADIQYDTLNIDPASVEAKITDRTRAIVCVHFGGYPCDLEELREIGRRHGLPLVEDSAHALGSKYRGDYIGSRGDYVTFSLQAVKIVTSGDGGLITTDSDESYEKLKRLVWYGIDRDEKTNNLLDPLPDEIDLLGFKHNMNDITATVGLVGLRHFDVPAARRREVGERYRSELAGLERLRLLDWRDDREPNYQIFPVHVEKREAFARFMRERGIMVNVNNRRNDRYAIFGSGPRDLPSVARAEEDTILLPIHYDLTDDDVERIIAAVREYDAVN
jgi:perosamine synthetase